MKINYGAVKNLSGQERLFRDYKIDLAYLFGSFAEGKVTPLSDFDIAVLLNPKVKKEDYFSVQSNLSDDFRSILKTEIRVDVSILNSASPLLRQQVVAANSPLYVSDEDKKYQFEAKTLRDYEDVKHLLRAQRKILFQKIKEEK